MAGENYPANFTKGLEHDAFGFVIGDYSGFTDAINTAPTGNPPVAPDFTALRPDIAYSTQRLDGLGISWRGWESPRTGHYYELQGPDSDALAMAPAPALGSAELAAEMAEVYAMAILRDVPFTRISDATGGDDNTQLDVAGVLAAFAAIPGFQSASDLQARRRLAARTRDPLTYDVNNPPTPLAITAPLLFRGSGPGAKAGPYISQFMLIGNAEQAENDPRDFEEPSAHFSPTDGFISYGNQIIDQRVRVFKPHLDYMTNWHQWLDVQNGANLRGLHVIEGERRFIATPRDLATYVRFDALYQAYLNACLLLLGAGFPVQDGFPDKGAGNARSGFAAFGGPHILSLVTEVATRCLKAVRRQKFNYHRRARPERIGGLLTVAAAVGAGLPAGTASPTNYGELTKADSDAMLKALGPILDLVAHHNSRRESGPLSNSALRRFTSPPNPGWLASQRNFLLAMAFPEGSPMHPAYGAGHATVAGGCVTMLKAFFRVVDAGGQAASWASTGLPAVTASDDGSRLDTVSAEGLTVEGELNKLAANVGIGRNMAGVHYYSDYYDSLRMGERVAIGILVEQMLTYDEPVSMTLRSFDGDLITLSSLTPLAPMIVNSCGQPVSYQAWWTRHFH